MSTSDTAAQSGSSPSPLFADFVGGVITSVPFDEETDAGHCYVIGPPQFRVSAANLVEAQRKISLQAWSESRGKWKRTWVSANVKDHSPIGAVSTPNPESNSAAPIG